METEGGVWFLGVDWASKDHRALLLDQEGRKLGERGFAHGGEGLMQMVDWALALSGARPEQIWVAIEVPHGPVVESLMGRGLRLFAINPKQADRFRDRFSPAGAKDDSRDSLVLGDALRTDPRAFRELSPTSPARVELREWSRIHGELGQERTRLMHQMREQLWRYYPQALDLADGDLDRAWFLELWTLAPTPAAVATLTEEVVGELLKRHRIRRIDAPAALARLQARPLAVAPGTTQAAVAHIELLVQRLRLVSQQIRQAERRLDELLARVDEPDQGSQGEAQRDVTILRSLPGVARIIAATLQAEASEPLQRRDYHALRCLSGVAPVTKRSGKALFVERRLAVNPRLANAVHQMSNVAVQRDPRSREKYTALRKRGHGHARALRTIGDRLLATACAMLESQTEYDPDWKRKAKSAPSAPL